MTNHFSAILIVSLFSIVSIGGPGKVVERKEKDPRKGTETRPEQMTREELNKRQSEEEQRKRTEGAGGGRADAAKPGGPSKSAAQETSGVVKHDTSGAENRKAMTEFGRPAAEASAKTAEELISQTEAAGKKELAGALKASVTELKDERAVGGFVAIHDFLSRMKVDKESLKKYWAWAKTRIGKMTPENLKTWMAANCASMCGIKGQILQPVMCRRSVQFGAALSALAATGITLSAEAMANSWEKLMEADLDAESVKCETGLKEPAFLVVKDLQTAVPEEEPAPVK